MSERTDVYGKLLGCHATSDAKAIEALIERSRLADVPPIKERPAGRKPHGAQPGRMRATNEHPHQKDT